MRKIQTRHSLTLLLFLLITFCVFSSYGAAFPLTFKDSNGVSITLTESPRRVVSLVPGITEMIEDLGAGAAIVGKTYHSISAPGTNQAQIVGGFFSPSLSAIRNLHPQVIFVSDIQKEVISAFSDGSCLLINLAPNSVEEIYGSLELLGKIFGKQERASEIIGGMKDQLDLIEQKVARIPPTRRKRVVRLMGADPVTCPGDDSFQNDFIKAAGGVPPSLGKDGNVVTITKEEWLAFNPQIIYGCGAYKDTAEKFLRQSGWKDVEAVRNQGIRTFPCEFTCRASVNAGHFISWLAGVLYGDEFSDTASLVRAEAVVRDKPVSLDLEYLKSAFIRESVIYDFLNKSLMIEFKKPMTVTSTLEGQRSGISTVGNHYTPPALWNIGHQIGLQGVRRHIYEVLGVNENKTSFLFTGADMDNISIQKAQYKDMIVYALVTGGAQSNAVAMSKDVGGFYEIGLHGTINMIIMTNLKLTPRAMSRAIISATEAKTTALKYLDIRSSYTGAHNQASGTGTDNIIVVEGEGSLVDNAGGHSKLGELIAKAVYDGVLEALLKQNRLTGDRDIFRRLRERGIAPYGLVCSPCFSSLLDKGAATRCLEELLLQPRYAAFVESSLALGDAYEMGLTRDLSAYELWGQKIAEEIAGRDIDEMRDLVTASDMQQPLRMALNALLNGVYYRELKQAPAQAGTSAPQDKQSADENACY